MYDIKIGLKLYFNAKEFYVQGKILQKCKTWDFCIWYHI